MAQGLTPSHSVARSQLPSNVAWFERLMYLSLGISETSFILRWYAHDLALSAALAFSFHALNLVFSVVCIWLAARRRTNWARWILLLVFIVSTYGYVPLLVPYLRSHGADALSLGLSAKILVQLVAFILIFTGMLAIGSNSRSWE